MNEQRSVGNSNRSWGRTRRGVFLRIVVALAVLVGSPGLLGATAQAAPVGQGFNLNRSDLRF
ncbi:MAG: hypothetical protein ACRCYX_10105, partial [Dermatophilaceae bacterium]